MKIQFLGTGAISSKFLAASYLIDEHILIDCGNGIVKQILNTDNNIYNINHLFISHLHGDHILDIPFLILMRSFIELDNSLVIYGPKKLKQTVFDIVKSVYEDIGDNWPSYEEKAHVRYEIFEESGVYHFDKYQMEYLTVDHGDSKDCYGFILKDDNSSIGFSGDAKYDDNIETIINQSSHAILDTSFMSANHSHMGADTIIELSKKHQDKILIPTHMNDDVRAYLKKLNVNNIKIYDDLNILEI